ncbi:MAG: translation initiation factor IF-2, partial [Verrucomicrobiae bacterium]|nr:translation initiation factor IF-2 [Verrucomicrobiae bacterium]
TVVEAVPGQETAEAEMEGKEREVEIEPVMQVKAQGEMSGVVVQPEEKPQVVQEPPSPPKPGIGDVVGRIDISKYLSKDKGREKEREKEKQKQKPQDQKKAVPVSGGKQQVQKPPQVAGKGQSMPGKPGQQPPKPQKPGQQQGKRQQVLEPVQLVKPQVSKDGRPVKMDKSAKLPPNAPVVMIKPPIVVRELAEKLGKKPFQVIAELVKRKIMANVNALVDEAVAKDIAAIFGINLVIEKRGAKPGPSKPEPKKPELEGEVDVKKLKPRPPVVTIMGHVDHGKTTLLDAIRKSNVVATEAGGITQHIGAYTIAIPHPDDKKKMMNITFLDTPGHAAFSAMRARGANVTDIVVLVVAADDGVMPQTVEALNHAKAANVPIIVAVNKCDHPNANPIRVREQLSKQGLTPEEWGGETIYVDVSALKKQGVDKLLEMIVLKAEMMELRADPDCPAKGFVVESALEAGGPAVTLLVKRGTLRVGDVVLCGQFFGKARALINEKNERQKEAGPSFAVKMLGLNGVPEPGQAFEVVEEQDKARELAESRAEEIKKQGQTAVARKVTLESLMEAIESNQVKVLKVVIKADTQGSVEAICGALKNIKSEKVSLEIIHDGVGPISESDVMLAAAAKGIVIGFHTKLEHGVSDIAKREGVQIKLYTIIYELIDEVKKAMAGLLEPIIKEVVTGKADVKKVFEISRGGKVAGCMVREGVMSRGRARVYRGRDLIYEGTMASLRHFQEEVNEIRAGMECGIRIEGFNDFQEGDVIECYNIEKALQELD